MYAKPVWVFLSSIFRANTHGVSVGLWLYKKTLKNRDFDFHLVEMMEYTRADEAVNRANPLLVAHCGDYVYLRGP